LGAGISGLIFAYYNPECIIISPEIGGQLRHGVPNSTVVHDSPETQQLYIDLKLEFIPGKLTLGYYYDGEVHDSCPLEINTKIIQKKMSNWYEPVQNFEVRDRILSVPENYIKVIKSDIGKLIDKLSSSVKIINDKIETITPTRLIGQNGEYEYDELISTIPANIFWLIYKDDRMATCVPHLESKPVTFITASVKPEWYNDKYDIIYFAEDFRHTRVSLRGYKKYTFEFTGIMPRDIFEELYKMPIENYFVNKFGRIHSTTNEPPIDKIKFLGRFAECHHEYKIQDVIKFAINNKIKI
jgi:hypothetical protein